MSRPSEFFGSAARFYTRATAIACACNLLAISCLVYTLLLRSSPSFLSSPSSTRFHAADPRPRLDAQSESRMREALEARLALEPVELIKRVGPYLTVSPSSGSFLFAWIDLSGSNPRNASPVQVKEIREESNTAVRRQQRNDAARRKYAAELAQKLKQLRKASSTDNQQGLCRRKYCDEFRAKMSNVVVTGLCASTSAFVVDFSLFYHRFAALEEWRKKKAHVKRKGAAAAAPRNND